MNYHFEYGYPRSNALLQFRLKLECCKQHNVASHSRKCDVINDVKLFPTVYHRIYYPNFRCPIRSCVTKASALELTSEKIPLEYTYYLNIYNVIYHANKCVG